eukprot:CCRYP_021152-RA/>CCRYP_021152-RA protein AED:0.45 eAED:1.00 QI:0/0/0/1/0/0/2/0/184
MTRRPPGLCGSVGGLYRKIDMAFGTVWACWQHQSASCKIAFWGFPLPFSPALVTIITSGENGMSSIPLLVGWVFTPFQSKPLSAGWNFFSYTGAIVLFPFTSPPSQHGISPVRAWLHWQPNPCQLHPLWALGNRQLGQPPLGMNASLPSGGGYQTPCHGSTLRKGQLDNCNSCGSVISTGVTTI